MILMIIKIRIPVALVNVNKAEVGGLLGDNGAIIAFGALVNMVWIKAKYPQHTLLYRCKTIWFTFLARSFLY